MLTVFNQKRGNYVFENMSFLMAMQLANYIFPLMTVPYLIRVLGIDYFGLISFAISFVQYFVILTDYSFNLTATRSISINRDNKEFVAREFWTVYLVKAAMMLISIAIYVSLIFTIDKFTLHSDVYLLCIFAILGNFLFPIWYFQGIERMKYIAVLNILTRLIFTVSLFYLVRQRDDYLIAVALQTGGVVVAGILALVTIAMRYPVQFIAPTVGSIRNCIVGGWAVFLTALSATLVNNSNIFILGLFADNTMTGLFAVAEKIVRVAINIIAPINAAIFPKVGKLLSSGNSNESVRYLHKVMKYGAALFTSISVMLFLFADILVRIITGQYNNDISNMIRIMSVAPLSIFIDNVYGTQVLVNIGKGREYMKAVLIPGIIAVVCSMIFVPLWKGYATAVIFMSSELAILVFMAHYVKMNGFNIFFCES